MFLKQFSFEFLAKYSPLGKALLSKLFVTQTSVAVMTSPGSGPGLERNRCSVKYETEAGCGECGPLGQKSHTERVVVALLFGALIIIFLTLVLSLVYLRETQQQQQQYSFTRYSQDRQLSTEERLVQVRNSELGIKLKSICLSLGA